MKFSDLPTYVQHFIFSFFDKDTLTQGAATVNREFANFTSQELTKRWIESPAALGWINLLGAKEDNLALQFFSPPRVVIRTALRSPDEAILGGFRRRGKKPLFLPGTYQEKNEYQPALLHSRVLRAIQKNDLDGQFPWDTMVSTFDFTDCSEGQFQEACAWGYEHDKRYDAKWIYFAAAHLGVKTNNHFKELALLGILPSDIIGAICVKKDRKNVIVPAEIWLNPLSTVEKYFPGVHNKIKDFFEIKIADYKLVEYKIEEIATEDAVSESTASTSASTSKSSGSKKRPAEDSTTERPASKKLKVDDKRFNQRFFAINDKTAYLLGLNCALTTGRNNEETISYLTRARNGGWDEVIPVIDLIEKIKSNDEADTKKIRVELVALCKKLLAEAERNPDDFNFSSDDESSKELAVEADSASSEAETNSDGFGSGNDGCGEESELEMESDPEEAAASLLISLKY